MQCKIFEVFGWGVAGREKEKKEKGGPNLLVR
jgi:hypothetical protein